MTTAPGRLWVVPTAASLHSRSLALDVSPATRSAWEQLRARVLYGGPVDHFPPPVIPFDRKAPAVNPCNPSECARPFSCRYYGPSAACTRRTPTPEAEPAPEFDSRLSTGAHVTLTRKDRPEERHEFTVAAIIRNGDRIIGVKPFGDGPRFNPEHYHLVIESPALPTKPGLYVAVDLAAPVDGDDDALVVFHLDGDGHWTRWNASRSYLESTTAYSVGREVGPDGLVELVAASS